MDNNISFPKDSEAYTIFNKVISDPNRFEDTYHERVYKNGEWKKTDRLEKHTPKTLVLRLRNAVSHDRLTIHSTSLRNNSAITGIEFSDKSPDKKEKFTISLTVKETEVLVKALSELLLSRYPGYKKDSKNK